MSIAVAPKEIKTESAPREYHWTVDSLYRAIDAGVFQEPKRLELIHGRIIENMGQNPPHASTRRRLARLLRQMLEPRFYVCDENPLRISFDGEPTPDIIVVTGKEGDYDERHPTPKEVILLVEISDTTAAYDLGDKSQFYAQSGIVDYWVVALAKRQIVIHRDPSPDGYRSVTIVGMEESLAPLMASDALLSVHDLLGIKTTGQA